MYSYTTAFICISTSIVISKYLKMHNFSNKKPAVYSLRFWFILAFAFELGLILIVSSDKVLNRIEEINPSYRVEWSVNFTDKRINFTVVARTKGYVGFGLSYNGGMKGADIVMGGVYPNGTSYFFDYHGIGNTMPVLDAKQDWVLLAAVVNETHTTLRFQRLLDTCGPDDIPIGEDTLKIIWALGETTDISYHGSEKRGAYFANFLDARKPTPDLTKLKKWTAATPVNLPGDYTTYWCTFFKGPVKTKHHIVGFDLFINGSMDLMHTHHIDMFRCHPPKGKDPNELFSPYLGGGYDCFASQDYFPAEHCQLLELQWVMGGKLMMFPKKVGLPFGKHPQGEYFLTVIHYNNPDMIPNMDMHSGMNVYYTDKLRPIDAGILGIGVKPEEYYSLTVPPNSENFVVVGHCPSGCTNNFPQKGINVFSYILHSHMSGRAMKLRHFREDVELPWFANDEHYDTNYQNNRMLRKRVKILPRDHLTLECTYDTRWKNWNATLGGRSTRDEMCLAFLMYFPRHSEVNKCGSYFPKHKILKYMGILNVTSEDEDPMVTMPNNLTGQRYSQVVQNIDWSETKRAEFQNMTRFGKQRVFCLPIKQKGTWSRKLSFHKISTGFQEV